MIPSSPAARTSRRSAALLFSFAALSCLAATRPSPAPAQPSSDSIPQRSPRDWAVLSSANEIRAIDHQGSFLRYRVHTVDAKSDRLREIVECTGGSVARLLASNGKPLTPEQDTAERQRLQDLAHNPDDFEHHSKEDAASKKLARDLVSLMPDAMIYTPVPGQENAHDRSGAPLVVFDFAPNPKWHPPTTTSEALTGLRGRVWVDARSGYVERMEGEVFRPVNFGFGMVAHIFPGGHLAFEQTDTGNGRWIYSHFTQQIRIRALMLKTIDFNLTIDASDFQSIPGPITYQQAIDLLLH